MYGLVELEGDEVEGRIGCLSMEDGIVISMSNGLGYKIIELCVSAEWILLCAVSVKVQNCIWRQARKDRHTQCIYKKCQHFRMHCQTRQGTTTSFILLLFHYPNRPPCHALVFDRIFRNESTVYVCPRFMALSKKGLTMNTERDRDLKMVMSVLFLPARKSNKETGQSGLDYRMFHPLPHRSDYHPFRAIMGSSVVVLTF